MLGVNWTEQEVPLQQLKPFERNPRTITKKAREALKASLQANGYHQRIIATRDLRIIGGHQRIDVLKELGIESIKVLTPDRDIPDEQFRQLLIQDNLPFGDWDKEILLADFSIEQLNDWGMDTAWLGNQTKAGLTDEDAIPPAPVEPISKLGDIWLLGEHRIMCGDSTDAENVAALLNGEQIHMVYTDPPYGVSVVGSNGKIGGDNLAKNGVYAPIAGDGDINAALKTIELIKTIKAKIEIIWGGNYYASSLENKASWIVWDKRGDMASNNFADCELAWCNKGSPARIYKQVWSGMIKEGEKGKRVHPTQKPVALAIWCIKEYGDGLTNVLDLFGGSGSTLIACEQLDRRCFMMEMASDYCDIIVRRWQDFTGKKAVHTATGEEFPRG